MGWETLDRGVGVAWAFFPEVDDALGADDQDSKQKDALEGRPNSD